MTHQGKNKREAGERKDKEKKVKIERKKKKKGQKL